MRRLVAASTSWPLARTVTASKTISAPPARSARRVRFRAGRNPPRAPVRRAGDLGRVQRLGETQRERAQLGPLQGDLPDALGGDRDRDGPQHEQQALGRAVEVIQAGDHDRDRQADPAGRLRERRGAARANRGTRRGDPPIQALVVLGLERALRAVGADRQHAEHRVEADLPDRRQVLARAQLAFAQRQLHRRRDTQRPDRGQRDERRARGVEHAQRDRDEDGLEARGEDLRHEQRQHAQLVQDMGAAGQVRRRP